MHPEAPGIVGRHTSYPQTDEQRAAITAIEPVVVVQGVPGSGKSAILCSHTLWLTTPHSPNPPIANHSQIAAVAFTQRAAKEIILRLHKADPTGEWNKIGAENPENAFIGTHHRFLLWLVNRFQQRLGYAETVGKVKYMTKKEKEEFLASCKGNIVTARTHGHGHDAMKGTDSAAQDHLDYLCNLRGLTYYERMLRDTRYLLKQTDILEQLRKLNLYLLIDEAQDLGPDETAIYLAFPAQQKYIVGDSGQAIFNFYDLGTSLLCAFARQPSTRCLVLSHNYRSSHSICAAASQLIKHHHPFQDTPAMVAIRGATRPEIPTAIHWECKSEADQLKFLPELISYYAEVNGKYHYNDVAVIYQHVGQEKQIVAALTEKNIPYNLENNQDRDRDSDRANQDANAVRLVRVTQCKGLSYVHVIIPFCTGNNWPGRNDPNLMRRQLYTAMTRAENTVHFLYHIATERDLFEQTGRPITGREDRTMTHRSPFLAEMNEPQPVVQQLTTKTQA